MTIWRKRVFIVAAVALLFLSAAFFFARPTSPEGTLRKYLEAVYTRDYREAYRFISAEDQRLKDAETYAREQGTFSGFTLEVARKFAGFMEARPLEKKINRPKAHVKLRARFPNGNAPELLGLLLDWNEEKLNRLASAEQKKILEKVDRLYKEGKIPMLEGEQSFELVKEAGQWKVFLNWAEGVYVSFVTLVPASLPLEAKPVQREATVSTGEPFNVYFKVRNLSNREVSTRIAHRVGPKEIADYLELIQCGLLLPVMLGPGEEEEYPSQYLVRGDLPPGTRRFEVTYEFVDEK